MTETTVLAPEPPLNAPAEAELRHAVGASAASLQEEYFGRRGQRQQARARGRLAVLRRSAGFTPEQHPLTMQEMLDSLAPSLLATDLGAGDSPSRTERAAFNAMTLFALHMQSAVATAPVHVRGRSFGTAAGLLRKQSESGSLKPRFDAMLAARDEGSRLTHARSLITLLRGSGIGFDYGVFARDLRTLASAHRAGVLLRWGRDFVMTPRSDRAHEPDPETTGAEKPDTTS